MKGILIYDVPGYNRNVWFAGRLTELGKTYGMDISLKVYTYESEVACDGFDFAIVRSIAPKLSKKFEDAGVKVFNNSRVSEIANSKWLTYIECIRLGIPVMPSRLYNRSELPDRYPCVLKSLDGHGGSEVFWADNDQEASKAVYAIDREYICQKPCSDVGIDMRVYVLGGNILQAVKRHSKTDFRSNFSLGGSIELADITPYQEDIIRTLHEELNFDLVGVDYIFNDGKWVLNEIEDVVGTRMLYKLTEIDAADVLLKHIAGKL